MVYPYVGDPQKSLIFSLPMTAFSSIEPTVMSATSWRKFLKSMNLPRGKRSTLTNLQSSSAQTLPKNSKMRSWTSLGLCKTQGTQSTLASPPLLVGLKIDFCGDKREGVSDTGWLERKIALFGEQGSPHQSGGPSHSHLYNELLPTFKEPL